MKTKLKSKLLILVSSAMLFFVMGYFVAYLGFPTAQAWVSPLAITFISLPTFYFFCKNLGYKLGLKIILALALFALVFEGQAILTGLPYSEFNYTDKITGKLFGIVPWSIGFAWTPLLIGSAYFMRRYFTKKFPILFILFTSLFLVLVDMVLDPGAVQAGLWTWAQTDGLLFYQIPLMNFFGWFVSGILGSTIFWLLAKDSNFAKLDNPEILTSLIWSNVFWTGVTLFHAQDFVYILGFLIYFLLIREFQKN